MAWGALTILNASATTAGLTTSARALLVLPVLQILDVPAATVRHLLVLVKLPVAQQATAVAPDAATDLLVAQTPCAKPHHMRHAPHQTNA